MLRPEVESEDQSENDETPVKRPAREVPEDRTGGREEREVHHHVVDPIYVDVILRRYEAVTGRRAVLEPTGETCSELAVRRQAMLS